LFPGYFECLVVQMVYNSIYSQLASFFFLFAAIFNDILLIRFCLVAANGLLIICAALGWPLWPNYQAIPNVAIDTLVWSIPAFVLHLWAFVVLVLDEQSMKRFDEVDCESLFQFFKRRSGIGRRDFLEILNKGKWTHIPRAGTVIPTDLDFHLIVEGYVNCEIEGWRRRDDDYLQYKSEPFKVKLGSGEVFDLRLANVFDVPIGFFNTSFEATTVSNDVLLFSWSIDALNQFTRAPPVVTQAWRNLIAFSVADIAHRPWLTAVEHHDHMRGQRHTDFAIPPAELEPKSTWYDFFAWVLRSMNPRMPRGLRHAAIPVLSIHSSQALLKDPRLSSRLHKV